MESVCYDPGMLDDSILAKISTIPSWYHKIEVAPGVITPGINDADIVLSLMDLPERLDGKRVLDLGARDGFFSFVCEARGAEVVPIDYVAGEQTGFNVARDLLGSKLQLRHDNVYNISREKYGSFDIVLFLGLFYHLRDPMFVLDAIRRMCRSTVYLETEIYPDDSADPLMRFHPLNSLNNDATNYWSPNPACLKAMMEESNFSVRQYVRVSPTRGLVVAGIRDDSSREYQASIARGIV
jgi:tRNA (mo5U34)-methyltransferase